MKSNVLKYLAIVIFVNGVGACRASKESNTVLADKIVVNKGERELQLFKGDELLKTYRVALGGDAQGPKQIEGDKKTPEGRYKIIEHNPNSQFYKSLRISYPNSDDKKTAARLGKSPGGDIMIHGLGKTYGFLGKSHVLRDWTLGCIAVTNEEIDEIYGAVRDGTLIEINP